jgi:hypothetical protein
MGFFSFLNGSGLLGAADGFVSQSSEAALTACGDLAKQALSRSQQNHAQISHSQGF